jgi:urease gamma subunit
MASKSQKPTTTGMIRQTSMTSSTADNPKSSANPTPFSNLKAAPLSAMTTTQTKPNTGNPVPSQSQPSLSDAQMQSLLNQCDWKDKTLWLSRQLFGGQSVNGFLRSTATVQRIKKQRARQVKLKSTDDVSITSASVNDKKRDLPDQVAEEALKQQVMNARTAKKLKAEMDAGLQFCALLHGTVRSILQDMNANAGIPIPPVLGSPESAAMMGSIPPPAGYIASQQGTASGGMPTTSQALKQNRNGASQPVSTAGTQYVTSQKTTASPGNPNGSTLRKNRKKKLPRNTEPVPVVSEFNAAGKRVVSKKEHQYRLFEALRFRALRKGDFVAARVSSRDLWILASVLQEYPGPTGKMDDFLQLSEAKRDQVFRNKVVIKDVEDKGEMGTSMISRNLVLPLPRSFSEAADWGQRCKKGSRLYAMYPETTSLYTATVMDNTTYCRGDDDIIVVEFDGDEPDVTGQIPKCHIPARFVTLIPREFSGSEPQATKKANSKTPQAAAGPAPALPSDDPIASLGDFAFDGFGDFDDMDFDLGFGA